jgi:hypothetical protein
MAKLIIYEGSPQSLGGSTGVTAALVGVLSFDDVAPQRWAIKKLLISAHAVVLDVAGGWPSVRLVVLRPDGRLAAALKTTGVAREINVAPDIDRAIAQLQIRPARVSRRAWLQPNLAARRQSHALADSVCRDWDVSHLAPRARTVMLELVDNLVKLTRTRAVLKVSLDDMGLRIALRDFSLVEGREPNFGAPGRRALDRLTRISDDSGMTPLSDGKAIWALLANRVAR